MKDSKIAQILSRNDSVKLLKDSTPGLIFGYELKKLSGECFRLIINVAQKRDKLVSFPRMTLVMINAKFYEVLFLPPFFFFF